MAFQGKKTVEKLEGGKKSVINHMFWCAATTDDNDDGDIREAMATSYFPNVFMEDWWVVTGKRNG